MHGDERNSRHNQNGHENRIDIGSVNRRHLSFMGSIPAPGRLIRDSAPAAAQLLVEDRVDAALLVPV